MSASPQPLDRFVAALDPEVAASVLDGAKSTHEKRTSTLADEVGKEGFERLRRTASQLKQHVLDNLDVHLDRAIDALERRGTRVSLASSAEEARDLVAHILAEARVKRVVKSKSMLTEELELSEHLEARGIECIETDLGEFIVQIDGDRPSHIVKPIIHKNRRQIADSFEREGLGPRSEDPETITRMARRHLRKAYLTADAGITGANFVSAESGRIVLVTNEGNARFCVSAPRLHVAVVGIEKLVPRDRDLAVFLALLGRSGTGQRLTVYTQFLGGPMPRGQPDGPIEQHVVFVDAGRSRINALPHYRRVLGCLRCGACLNVCPVYRQASGHGYRSVYPGPVGSVLAPLLAGEGFSRFADLPKACSMCGACGEVCPAEIPLPDLLLRLRDEGHRRTPEITMAGTPSFAAYRHLATRPRGWRWSLALGAASERVPDGVLSLHPAARAWLRARARPLWRGGRFRQWWATRTAPGATQTWNGEPS